MHGRLLMANQNVPDFILLKELVINRKDCAAGIAKNHLNALIDQGLDYQLSTRQLNGHVTFLCNNNDRYCFRMRTIAVERPQPNDLELLGQDLIANY